jgi:hypothetical protein
MGLILLEGVTLALTVFWRAYGVFTAAAVFFIHGCNFGRVVASVHSVAGRVLPARVDSRDTLAPVQFFLVCAGCRYHAVRRCQDCTETVGAAITKLRFNTRTFHDQLSIVKGLFRGVRRLPRTHSPIWAISSGPNVTSFTAKCNRRLHFSLFAPQIDW